LIDKIYSAFYLGAGLTFLPQNLSGALGRLLNFDSQQAAIRNQYILAG
jgi:hypothetical protein